MEYLGEEDVRVLLANLVQRTTDRSSLWMKVDDEYTFQTAGKKFTYRISSVDNDDLAPFIFEIWNGDPGEGPWDTNPGSKLQSVLSSEYSQNNDLLMRLYEKVKKIYMNADSVAAEILSDFD